MRTGYTAALLGCTLAAGLTPRASADVITLGSARDTTIWEDSGGLGNGAGSHLFAGARAGLATKRRALLAFDVAESLPAGATINSVSLTLRLTRTNNSPAQLFSLHRVLADWGEGNSNAGDPGGMGAPATPGDATWSHAFFNAVPWTTPGGDFESAASATITVTNNLGSFTWGSTDDMVFDVQSWLDDPETDFGWMLMGSERNSGSARRFASRENASAAWRPSLRIDYTPVPEPASLILLAAGASLIIRRRRAGRRTVRAKRNTPDLGRIIGNCEPAAQPTWTWLR